MLDFMFIWLPGICLATTLGIGIGVGWWARGKRVERAERAKK